MRYYEMSNDGYILAVGDGDIGEEISKPRHDEILSKIHARPTPPDGYDYRLRSSDLDWVLIELPPESDPELTDEEALAILLGEGGAGV